MSASLPQILVLGVDAAPGAWPLRVAVFADGPLRREPLRAMRGGHPLDTRALGAVLYDRYGDTLTDAGISEFGYHAAADHPIADAGTDAALAAAVFTASTGRAWKLTEPAEMLGVQPGFVWPAHPTVLAASAALVPGTRRFAPVDGLDRRILGLAQWVRENRAVPPHSVTFVHAAAQDLGDPAVIAARDALASQCQSLSVALRFVAVSSLGDLESLVQLEGAELLNRRSEIRRRLPRAGEPLEAGQIVDRYLVEAVIGRGGMADVYRVRHTTLGSQHALKLLHTGGASLWERLVDEGKVQARVLHPNIVRVTDLVHVAGQPALVMDYIDGSDLDVWLANHPVGLDARVALFRGVLDGVEYAHQHGMVHRDLKPGNVLIATKDGKTVPMISDFGLVKILDHSFDRHAGRRPESMHGRPMGTPQYMAPEQVRNGAAVDARADVFALGCLLYDLVTGKLPFNGEDGRAVMIAVLEGDYAPLGPHVPPAIVAAVAGSLVVDRARRLQSCAALRRVLDGEPLSAALPRSPTPSGDAVTWAGDPAPAPVDAVPSPDVPAPQPLAHPTLHPTSDLTLPPPGALSDPGWRPDLLATEVDLTLPPASPPSDPGVDSDLD